MESPLRDMKTVLIVDNEPDFLRRLAEGFRRHAPGLRVCTALFHNGSREMLRTGEVDLLIVDLKRPPGPGLRFLHALKPYLLHIPVIILSPKPFPSLRRRLPDHPLLQLLEKPVDVRELADLAGELLTSEVEGHLRGISLTGFLQLLEMERKSCTLKITAGSRVGFLYLLEGHVVDARTDTRSGQQAALEIIAWDEPEIRLLGAPPIPAARIREPLHHLLLEAMRLKDESSLR